VAGCAVLGLSAQAIRWTFDDVAVGETPVGLRFVETRDAEARRWTVRKDGDNHVLARSGEPSSSRGFALAILNGIRADNLRAAVRMKLVDGSRSGGLVWRYQGPDQYYLVRVSLREQDIGLYRVVGGNRVRLEGEDDLELDPSAWYRLEVRHLDDRIRVYLGGIKVFDTLDRTIRDAGGVGLWTTDDSVGYFDDLGVRGDDRP
jgi:hypothetical protein